MERRKLHVHVHVHVQVHDEKAQEYSYRTVKNRQPPGIEPGASDFSCQCSST